MHWIKLKSPLELVRGKGPNPEGDYLVENRNAGEYIRNHPHVVEINHQSAQVKPFDPSLDWNGKRVGLVRPGGLGDIMFLTPLLRELKQRWPKCIIVFCAVDHFSLILDNNPHVDEVVPYPMPEEVYKTLDSISTFEDVLEHLPAGREKHAIDCFSGMMGIELTNKAVEIYLTKDERDAAVARCPRKPGLKRVGVQLRASALARTYPHVFPLCKLLADKGYEVFIFNAPGAEPIKTDYPNVVDVINLDPSPSFRESMAILLTCDVLVGPDSSLTHAAGAFGIPCIALYGPFPWQLRTAYAPTTRAIQGNAPCAPCFFHVKDSGEWPVNGPCFKIGHCIALEGIDPKRVLKKVEDILCA